MDTDNILLSLTNLRDSLNAVESARQQVNNNVAAYDKVRQQLADTSTLISQILSDFTDLSSALNVSQQAVETEIEVANKKMLATLNNKAVSIAGESQAMIESVRNTTESVKAQLLATAQDAIERIHLSTLNSREDIKNCLQDIQSNFDKAVQSSLSLMQKEVNKFSGEIYKSQNKFDTSLTSQLSRLSTAVNGHLSEMSSLVQSLFSQINSLKKENKRLEDSISSIGNTNTKLSEEVESLKQQNLSVREQKHQNKTFIIVGIVVILIPIILTMLKIFNIF